MKLEFMLKNWFEKYNSNMLVPNIIMLIFMFTEKPNKTGVPEIMGTDKSSVALKWSPPTMDGGAPVDYVIEYRRKGSFTWVRANSVPVQETNFSVTGLKEGDEYEFRITPQNKAGLGPASEISEAVKVETPLGM